MTSQKAILHHDLICFSHLRWNFVYQRPQHLLSRFALHTRVFFVEEPFWEKGKNGSVITRVDESNVYVHQQYIDPDLERDDIRQMKREALEEMIREHNITDFIAWYYTPQAIPFTNAIAPALTVYDCMDELSAFKNPPGDLRDNEALLLKKADIVFTGGNSLYEAKKQLHSNIHAFPSSIDREHFAVARGLQRDPEDQREIGKPRIGFYGVVDERFNTQLLDAMSQLRPGYHFVVIGPVVKIDPESLPHRENIHYLGAREYKELPAYLSGWDAAMMPFAINDSTRFISPTKTPEFLAAGKPVVSTPINDVVQPYGTKGYVSIADTAEEFVTALDRIFGEILSSKENYEAWLRQVDQYIDRLSWDSTWSSMRSLMEDTLKRKSITNKKTTDAYV